MIFLPYPRPDVEFAVDIVTSLPLPGGLRRDSRLALDAAHVDDYTNDIYNSLGEDIQ
jgi:hypothetical protein